MQDGFGFDPLFAQIADYTQVCGYFQSVKYFGHNGDKIASLFPFKDDLDAENIRLLSGLDLDAAVAVHVRRGDYVHNKALNVDLSVYYRRAIQRVTDLIHAPQLVIFSDDPTWASKNLDLPMDAIYVDWNKHVESFKDMQSMSLFRYQITANSSFSWWSSLLNKRSDKVVYMPYPWF